MLLCNHASSVYSFNYLFFNTPLMYIHVTAGLTKRRYTNPSKPSNN